MEELELLVHAKTYMEKLANGVNPITDEEVDENDIINNVRLSRCFFYVVGVLDGVIKNGGIGKRKKLRKQPFTITDEQIEKYVYFEQPVALSHIIERINGLIDTVTTKKITYSAVAKGLMRLGLLEEANGRFHDAKYCPTESGIQLGMSMEKREGDKGVFYATFYDNTAQEFLLNHLQAIISQK